MRILLEKANNWKFSHDPKIRLFLLQMSTIRDVLAKSWYQLRWIVSIKREFQRHSKRTHWTKSFGHIKQSRPKPSSQITDEQFFQTTSNIVNTFNGKYLRKKPLQRIRYQLNSLWHFNLCLGAIRVFTPYPISLFIYFQTLITSTKHNKTWQREKKQYQNINLQKMLSYRKESRSWAREKIARILNRLPGSK